MSDKKTFDQGVYDISNTDYHESAGISRSGIMEFRKSPKHYWHRYLNPEYKKDDETPAMIFGSAFHCYVLEPGKFDKQYFISQTFDKRTTKGKEDYANMLIESQGKTPIDKDTFLTIEKMAQVLIEDEQARELISDAKYEQSIYWIDPDTGLLCKCRPDIWHDNFIVDLKTSNDASPRVFQRDFYSYGYHLQLAMMYEGIKHTQGKLITNFIDLAIEKNEPHCHAIYPIDETALEYGIKEFKLYLMRIKHHMDKNEWPSYPTQTISLPPYATIGDL